MIRRIIALAHLYVLGRKCSNTGTGGYIYHVIPGYDYSHHISLASTLFADPAVAALGDVAAIGDVVALGLVADAESISEMVRVAALAALGTVAEAASIAKTVREDVLEWKIQNHKTVREEVLKPAIQDYCTEWPRNDA